MAAAVVVYPRKFIKRFHSGELDKTNIEHFDVIADAGSVRGWVFSSVDNGWLVKR